MVLNKVAQMWVRALRSGKYKQTKNHLTKVSRSGTIHNCCLGVLCELAVKKGVISEVRDEKVFGVNTRFYNNEENYLPKAVQKWAGLKNTRGQGLNVDLAKSNDDGVSFKKIADLIEEYAETLFVRKKA